MPFARFALFGNSSRRAARALLASLALFSLRAAGAETGPRRMEDLGRGVVAIQKPDRSVFVSWRLLGTEPLETSFKIGRAHV